MKVNIAGLTISDQDSFFGEVQGGDALAGLTVEEDCEPVLTFIDQGTDQAVRVPVTSEFLSRLSNLLEEQAQWSKEMSFNSPALA